MWCNAGWPIAAEVTFGEAGVRRRQQAQEVVVWQRWEWSWDGEAKQKSVARGGQRRQKVLAMRERGCGVVLRAGWQAGSREKTGRANRRLGRVGRTIGKKKATARTHALQVRLVDFQWMDHDQVRAPPMEPRIALPRFPS